MMHEWTREQLRIIRLAAVEANMILFHVAMEHEDLGIRVKAPGAFDAHEAQGVMMQFAERVVTAHANGTNVEVQALMTAKAVRVAEAYGTKPPYDRNGIQVDVDWFTYDPRRA